MREAKAMGSIEIHPGVGGADAALFASDLAGTFGRHASREVERGVRSTLAFYRP
ncbi:MAG: PCRF domain-containing protein [Nocardioides sp.]